MDDKEVIIKYSSYTPSQKKATQKYREMNKDKINEQRKEYYKQRKEVDPEFLEYKRTKAKEYYKRKKDKIKEPEPVIESIPVPVIETPIESLIVEKKTRKKKDKKIEPEQIEKPVEEEKKIIEEPIIEVPIIDETIKEKKERKKRTPKAVKFDS